MEQVSHITLKDAAELLKYPYPYVKGLLEYSGIEGLKQGVHWIYSRKDIESLSLKLPSLKLENAFEYQDDCEPENLGEMVGYFNLTDGTTEHYKACPTCGSSAMALKWKETPKGERYAFVRCKECNTSTDSSRARDKNLFASCEREAINNWNRRP